MRTDAIGPPVRAAVVWTSGACLVISPFPFLDGLRPHLAGSVPKGEAHGRNGCVAHGDLEAAHVHWRSHRANATAPQMSHMVRHFVASGTDRLVNVIELATGQAQEQSELPCVSSYKGFRVHFSSEATPTLRLEYHESQPVGRA